MAVRRRTKRSIMETFGFAAPKERQVRIKIKKEIPIGYMGDGSVVFLPVDMRDLPVIGIAGRRGCIGANEKIYGSYPKKIKNFSGFVATMSKSQNVFESIGFKVNSGFKECYKIKTKSGREMIASSEHIFITFGDEKRCNQLIVGDKIPIAIKFPFKDNLDEFAEYELNWDFGYLVGLYLSEGHCSKPGNKIVNGKLYKNQRNGTAVGFTIADNVIAEKLMFILDNLGISYKITRRREDLIHRVTTRGSRHLQDFLIKNFKNGARKKKIPKWVFLSNIDFKKGLLSGYMSGDGMVHKRHDNSCRIRFSSVSRELRNSLVTLFHQFGIFCYLSTRVKNHRNWANAYVGEIARFSQREFLENIRMIESIKQDKLDSMRKTKRCNIEIERDIIRLLNSGFYTRRDIINQLNICRKTLRKFDKKYGKNIKMKKKPQYVGPQYTNTDGFYEYKNVEAFKLGGVSENIFWDKIDSITPYGKKYCYDMQVPDTNTFMMANGIISHNSGKSMLIHSLIDRINKYTNHKGLIANDVKGESYSWKWPQDDPNLMRIFSSGFIELREGFEGLSNFITTSPAYCTPKNSPKKLAKKQFFVELEEIKSSDVWKCIMDFGSKTQSFVFDSVCVMLSKCKSYAEIENFIENEKDLDNKMKKAIKLRIKTYMNYPSPPEGNSLIKSPDISGFTTKDFLSLFRHYRWVSIVTNLCGSYKDGLRNFYLANVFDWVYRMQLNAVHFPSKYPEWTTKLWIIVDEIDSFCSTTEQNHGAAQKLRELANRGRTAGIGIIWANQKYAKVSKFLRSETEILFTFNPGSRDNRKAIMDDMTTSVKVFNDLGHLRRHEVMAITKDIPFVILKPTGNKTRTTKPIQFFPYPSLSMHLGAGETVDDFGVRRKAGIFNREVND